ncbi:hypothetical protein [Caudoviricetes sp.]|nr:hypothetical protein [Caudoviricetes sp.]
MPFNPDKFLAAKLEPRREAVPVPALSGWFEEGEEPIWTVRGLTSDELNLAMEARARRASIENVIDAIAKNDQAQAVREMIGLTKGSPAEVVKRLEMLVMGSVSPKIELPVAVKLAEAFPIEFLTLTNKITSLTGMGFDIVKPEAASQPITH